MSVAYAILGALERGAKTAYRLRAELAESVGLIAPLGEAQVYATLARLARRGWVARAEAAPGREVRPYRLTPLGRAALEEWLRRPPRAERRADELADRFAALLAARDAARLERLAARQVERIRALRGAIAEYEREDGVPPLSALLLRTARRHLEVDAAWILELAADARARTEAEP